MIYLRIATADDMDLIYKWANDSIVRNNSFNSAPIPYENHKKWFSQILSNDKVLQFILMDDEVPIGQIRLNIDDIEAEISYSIASEFRGKGYGHKILKLVAKEVENHYPQIEILVAKVKPDNSTSAKLFESEGYDMKYFCYTLSISELGER